jgi:hypothetical protein
MIFNDTLKMFFLITHVVLIGTEVMLVAGVLEHKYFGPAWDLGQKLHM